MCVLLLLVRRAPGLLERWFVGVLGSGHWCVASWVVGFGVVVCRVVFVCWFVCVGLLGLWCVCLFVGLSVRCVGLLVCWFGGVSVCWCVGLPRCWCAGPPGRWSVGVLVCWCVGVLVGWLPGVVRVVLRVVCSVCVGWFIFVCACWCVGMVG